MPVGLTGPKTATKFGFIEITSGGPNLAGHVGRIQNTTPDPIYLVYFNHRQTALFRFM